jgi:hypothetical protein
MRAHLPAKAMIFPTIFSFLLNKALTVADRVIDSAVDKYAPREAAQPTWTVDDVVRQSTEQLAEITKASRDAVIGKIEADKLEELHSRVQNLGFVIRLNKVNEAFGYLLTVKESVDYAENRLREGKGDWLSAVIIGKTTVVAALTHLQIDSASETAALVELCKRARHELLDQLAQQSFENRQSIPWDRVYAFLQGGSLATDLFGSSQSPSRALGENNPDDVPSAQGRADESQVFMRETDYDAEVLRVYVKVGDKVLAGQCIVDVETRKAVLEIPAPYAGVVTHVHVKIGEAIKSAALIASIQREAQSAKSVIAPTLWPFSTSSRP